MVLLAAILGSSSRADDLAALARKERARRAAIQKPVKVLTEEDARHAVAEGAGSVTALPERQPTPGTSATEASSAKAARDAAEGSWRRRAALAKTAVESAQKKLEQLEQELATVRSDIAPLSAAEAQDPLRLQKKEVKLAEINERIQAQKAAIDETRKALSTLEDEARRNGVPPGWLR